MEHQYLVTVYWAGNEGSGTSAYKSYSRDHSVIIENKLPLFCSSDANFMGDKNKYTPEDLFVASVSQCHMLWYLHLCADEGVIVTGYIDNAEGYMTVEANGSGHFTLITLHPQITITDASMVQKANELHHKANQFCFIANSCNFPVHHKPTIKIA